jgi:peroxiredoxin
MTRIKQTALFAASATLAVAALAFAQAKHTMDAAVPTVGVPSPAYSLPDQNGLTHTLAADRGKVVLLAFYPADFTGGCTIEAHSLSAAYPSLKAEGVTVYGVSVQDSKSHKSFCTSAGIPYTLLADTQKTMTTAYGDLIPGAGFANRVTYIIGADGKVAFVDKNVNGHLNTCGADWAAWVKAHKSALVGGKPVSSVSVTDAMHVYQWPFQTVKLERMAPATVGYAAPSFSLANAVTGQVQSLPALAQGKKATVVMFISTRCPVSNAYNERMTTLAKKYAAQGVSFVGVDSDQNEPKAEVASFTKQQGFPFPVLVDPGNKVSNAYNAHVTPETYVIDSKGVLVYHGRIDNDMDTSNAKTHELADALDATLAGWPIVKSQTKAFGCSIKRIAAGGYGRVF